MKIYRFDKKLLAYKQLDLLKIGVVIGFAFVLVGALSSFICSKTAEEKIKKVYVETEKKITLESKNEFSKEKLVKLIKELHIKHPEIVFSQFSFESGHFTSPLFKNQNNLMGMRLATSRPTTAIGEENGYAVYKDWRDCVIDYALYQSSFLRGADKEDYYEYLQSVYAKDKNYVAELKNFIKQNNIKQLFK